MHFPYPQIWEENGGTLIARMQLTWLAVVRGRQWSRVTRGRSRVPAAGSRRWQEWGNAACPGLGGAGVPVVGSKGSSSGVPAAAYHSAREEGTGSAGTLGEESLWCPYVPPSCDWCVPH